MSQHCDCTMSSCLFQRHFSNRFLYCISYILLFYTSNKYSHKMLICNFFFNFIKWFQALAKGLIMFIYMLYSFLLSKSKMQATKKSCLPGFLFWGTLKPHFLRFETKLSQIYFIYFFTVHRITYYFPVISEILEDCEVAILYHHFLY